MFIIVDKAKRLVHDGYFKEELEAEMVLDTLKEKHDYKVRKLNISQTLNAHIMQEYLTNLLNKMQDKSNFILCKINCGADNELKLVDSFEKDYKGFEARIKTLINTNGYINYANGKQINEVYLVVTLRKKNSYSSSEVDKVIPFYVLPQEHNENMNILTNFSNLWFMGLSMDNKKLTLDKVKDSSLSITDIVPTFTTVDELLSREYIMCTTDDMCFTGSKNFGSWQEAINYLNTSKTYIENKQVLAVDDFTNLGALEKLKILLISSVPKEIENKTLKELTSINN